MKKMKRCLPLALLLASCISQKSYRVEVQNLSAKRFDSVYVFINSSTDQIPTVKSGSLSPGEAIPPLDVGSFSTGVSSKTDKVTAIFYAADTVIKADMSNDGEKGANLHYKATIDSSLQVKWKVSH
jgi:hypothetical protein